MSGNRNEATRELLSKMKFTFGKSNNTRKASNTEFARNLVRHASRSPRKFSMIPGSIFAEPHFNVKGSYKYKAPKAEKAKSKKRSPGKKTVKGRSSKPRGKTSRRKTYNNNNNNNSNSNYMNEVKEKKSRSRRTQAPTPEIDEVKLDIPEGMTFGEAIIKNTEFRNTIGELDTLGYKLVREGRMGGVVVFQKQ